MSETPPPMAAPGWYPAPGEARTKRYWDGERWTSQRAPMYVDPQSQSQPTQVSPEEPAASSPLPEPQGSALGDIPPAEYVWIIVRAVFQTIRPSSLFWGFLLAVVVALLLGSMFGDDQPWIYTAAFIIAGGVVLFSAGYQAVVAGNCLQCRTTVRWWDDTCRGCGASTAYIDMTAKPL